METSNVYKVECLISNLIRQYPTWPSTFSMCECNRMMGRGGGKCALCIEDELAEIIDAEFANDIHMAISHLAKLKSEALELAESMK